MALLQYTSQTHHPVLQIELKSGITWIVNAQFIKNVRILLVYQKALSKGLAWIPAGHILRIGPPVVMEDEASEGTQHQ